MRLFNLKTYAILTTFALLLVACGGGTHSLANNGGGGGSTPATTKRVAVGFSMIPGFHALSSTSNKQTTAQVEGFSFIPKVYAQTTTTTTFSGSYNASCASAPSIGQDGALALFGMGQIGNPQCNDFLFFLDQDGSGHTSGAYSVPVDVQGSGQLTKLKVTFGEWGNTNLSQPDSGLIDVWVHRGTQVVGNLECQPKLDTVSNRYKCEVTGAVNVLEGDTLSGAIKVHAGDTFKNVQVFLTQG